jgi:circadian clock protein KaiB
MIPRKTYILKLYVAGNTPNSMRALKTLRNILETEFRGVYALKVIDVLKNPQLAEEEKILATPTLAKILPPPVRRIIGDLSDRERVLIGLDLLYEELSDEGFSNDEIEGLPRDQGFGASVSRRASEISNPTGGPPNPSGGPELRPGGMGS